MVTGGEAVHVDSVRYDNREADGQSGEAGRLGLWPGRVAGGCKRGQFIVADRRIGILLVATGLVAVGMGCSSQGDIPAESETSQVVVVERTPSPESRRLCDAAFSSSVATDALALAAPTLWLIREEYEADSTAIFSQENEGWMIHLVGSGIETEPRTLACISESREWEGKYEGGGDAFRRVWTVRLVRWGEGSAFVEQVFSGGAPPSGIFCDEGPGCDGYGLAPIEALEDWLDDLIGEASP